jgi:N-acyl homoserine lactone hydrolase
MKLYLMVYATIGKNRPVPGYLVQTDDGTNILIDTGFPRQMLGAHFISDAYPRIEEEGFVLNQLAKIGLTTSDIHYVVITHFDIDHAGAMNEFPDAEIVVQQSHYDAALTGDSQRFEVTRPQWSDPNVHYHFVAGDTELVPSVELIDTSGHVPGHQSLLIRLPNTGPVILTIDAVTYQGQANADTRKAAMFDMDEHQARASTRKLADLAQREQASLIIYGHDANQWQALKLLPKYYD